MHTVCNAKLRVKPILVSVRTGSNSLHPRIRLVPENRKIGSPPLYKGKVYLSGSNPSVDFETRGFSPLGSLCQCLQWLQSHAYHRPIQCNRVESMLDIDDTEPDLAIINALLASHGLGALEAPSPAEPEAEQMNLL